MELEHMGLLQREVRELKRLLQAVSAQLEYRTLGLPQIVKKEGLQQWLGLSEASITRIVARPDFPRPILLTETKQGAKAWLAKEVAEWLHQNQAKVPRGRQRSK